MCEVKDGFCCSFIHQSLWPSNPALAGGFYLSEQTSSSIYSSTGKIRVDYHREPGSLTFRNLASVLSGPSVYSLTLRTSAEAPSCRDVRSSSACGEGFKGVGSQKLSKGKLCTTMKTATSADGLRACHSQLRHGHTSERRTLASDYIS